MTKIAINLLASDDVPLEAIASAACLQRDDLLVNVVKLDAAFYAQEVSHPGPFFLFLTTQSLALAGERTKRVRRALGANRRLVLCMPRIVDANQLLRMGADEIITPASQSPTDIAERVLGQLIGDEMVQRNSCGELRGATTPMYKLYHQIKTLAPFEHEPVLILGGSGSGKELVARELHNQSPRQKLVTVNMAEVKPELFESELFGHVKGAFTNAIAARSGLIDTAEGGTIFLDEIGTLDISLQAKLLRVIEQKQIRRVGANELKNVDVRFIFATNKDLEEECNLGRFQRDFLARIRGFTIEVPPLRERKADIPLLCNHFLEQFKSQYKIELKFPPNSLDCLFRYDWPENVRELQGVLKNAAVFVEQAGEVSANVLQEATQRRTSKAVKNAVEFDPWFDTWPELKTMAAQAYFRAVLVAANGNPSTAIKMSGLSKAQFYYILKKLGLE